MKKIIVLAAGIAASATVLAACGSGAAGVSVSEEDALKYAGNWNIKSIIAGGEELNIEELFSAVGQDATIGLNLEKDGSASLSLPSQDPNKGTWKVSGNDTLLLTLDGNDEAVTLKDGQLVMSHGEGENKLELVFSK